MSDQIKPDVAFEPSQSVKTGFSTPIFIIKQVVDTKPEDDVYYLTKVVWRYDPNLAGDDDDLQKAIEDIKGAFDGAGENSFISVREVQEDKVSGIIEGFTR